MNEVRWNLPLAISLRGHKRASDIGTRRWLSGRCRPEETASFVRTVEGERKGNHHADHQLQGHVHRRAAGAGKPGRAARRCVTQDGRGGLASVSEKRLDASSRGNAGPEETT